MKTIKNNLMKLTGVNKAYYIVALVAAPIVILICALAILNMVF